jgi:hypothetical protein
MNITLAQWVKENLDKVLSAMRDSAVVAPSLGAEGIESWPNIILVREPSQGPLVAGIPVAIHAEAGYMRFNSGEIDRTNGGIEGLFKVTSNGDITDFVQNNYSNDDFDRQAIIGLGLVGAVVGAGFLLQGGVIGGGASSLTVGGAGTAGSAAGSAVPAVTTTTVGTTGAMGSSVAGAGLLTQISGGITSAVGAIKPVVGAVSTVAGLAGGAGSKLAPPTQRAVPAGFAPSNGAQRLATNNQSQYFVDSRYQTPSTNWLLIGGLVIGGVLLFRVMK